MANYFVWHDAREKAAAAFENLKEILIERFEILPMTVRVERFFSTRQL